MDNKDIYNFSDTKEIQGKSSSSDEHQYTNLEHISNSNKAQASKDLNWPPSEGEYNPALPGNNNSRPQHHKNMYVRNHRKSPTGSDHNYSNRSRYNPDVASTNKHY